MPEPTTTGGGSEAPEARAAVTQGPGELDGSETGSTLAATNAPIPTVGRIVHYVSYGTPGGEFLSECRAAIVAGIPEGDSRDDELVDLVVFNPQGLFFNRVPYSARKKGGTWHWPERSDG